MHPQYPHTRPSAQSRASSQLRALVASLKIGFSNSDLAIGYLLDPYNGSGSLLSQVYNRLQNRYYPFAERGKGPNQGTAGRNFVGSASRRAAAGPPRQGIAKSHRSVDG